MPPMAAADAFLVLEFVAGNRRIPHDVFAALLASLPSPNPRISSRLRKTLVLRTLHAALHVEDASSSFTTLLREARRVLAHPDAAAFFPEQPPSFSLPDDKDDDEARAAAAVAGLKRLIDHEWANLPPSTLELAADRIAGGGALETWASADDAKRRRLRLLVGEFAERQILARLGQDTSASHPLMAQEIDKAANVPNSSGANETDRARGDDETGPFKENNEAQRAQEDRARHQQESVKGASGVLPEKPIANGTVNGKVHVTSQVMDTSTTSHVIGQSAPDCTKSHPVAASKHSLMERSSTASTYEWNGLGDSDDEWPLGKRQLPPFERKPKPSPTFSLRTRNKWSEIEEKTLLEGVEKYGKGNWKDIKMAYPDVFEDRSTVDLKDKFRNMERQQSV